MNRISMLFALLLCLGTGLARGADDVVSIRTIAPTGALEPGKAAVLNIELEIASPYHINSNSPLQDYLIPTTLDIEPQTGVTFGKAVFPPAPVKKLPVLDSPMAVYEGSIRVAFEVVADTGLGLKDINVRGRVRYQACNDRACLPPVTKPFSLVLPVFENAISSNVSRPTKAVEALQPQASEIAERGTAPYSADFGNRGLLVTFALVFLGGLALNLTPCVYPMIPITITYFGGQAQGKKGSLIAHSSVYVVGMAVTYSILGVVAALTGGLFGAANQYPPVLIGIGLVMIALALSMFNVYELRMPQSLNRLAGSSQKGFLGTFLMGLTVGIVAAPCIGPFVLGLLTYVGKRGNAPLGFALFFVLALGLGVPFLVLGTFSGSIRRLPRSGAWMVWVRKIFGFILLAMAVYFVKPLFPKPMVYHLTIALIMLLAGIYLAWIDNVPNSGKAFSYVRTIVGILFFAASLYAAVTGLELNAQKTQLAAGQSYGAAIEWLPYSESALGRASAESKPVFIDFYADWCAPCKELDNKTFAAPEVVRRSKEFIMLKVDLTTSDNAQAEALRKKFQARGVPTLVFLGSDGQEITGLRGTGFESKDVFLKKMEQALGLKSSPQKGPM